MSQEEKESTKAPDAPRRYIYNQIDMEHFRHSKPRKELLSFVTALGRSCYHQHKNTNTTSDNMYEYEYNPQDPLVGLSPAMASLHGSLTAMAQSWTKEIPSDPNARARFGNPAFRTWHTRLVERSEAIIGTMLQSQKECMNGEECKWKEGMKEEEKKIILESCAKKGHQAAVAAAAESTPDQDQPTNHPSEIIQELRAYLHDSFGHPIRIDYGTGHESSFLVFLYATCRLGCFSTTSTCSSTSPTSTSAPPQSYEMHPVALSILSAYLQVCRSVQTDYILEPAGTHGVWGLDDYHCVPFYIGACQMIHRAQHQQTQKQQQPPHQPQTRTKEEWSPQIIHQKQTMTNPQNTQTYMYLGCIQYIQSLKKGVPFFESSPMLNDISNLPNWDKVAGGLLRLYEGEVLEKLPVVQHFVFGRLFQATWTPSQKEPTKQAPTQTFLPSTIQSHVSGPGGDACVAPWAKKKNKGESASSSSTTSSSSSLSPMPPTRAPWAK